MAFLKNVKMLDTPGEMNLIQSGSSYLQLEAIPLTNPLDSFQEVAKPKDKCVVFIEDIKLTRLGLENKDDMPEPCPAQFCEELLNEPKTNKLDSSHSAHENDGNEGVMDTCYSTVDEDFQVEEAKLLENAYKDYLCDSSLNSTLEGLYKNPKEGAAKLTKMDTPKKYQIATPISKDEDSPVFNYINSLSPIIHTHFHTHTCHQFFRNPLNPFHAHRLILPNLPCISPFL